jgi:chaperone BCS1
MSDTDSNYDSHRSSRRRRAKSEGPKKQPNFLKGLPDPSIENSMNKPLFQLIRSCINGHMGIDLTYLVWAIALCVPAKKYGSEAFDWLSENVTNSLLLDRHEVITITTDLLIWISKRPSNQLFAWLPTFEHLEWKDLVNKAKTKDDEEGKTHQLIASAGYTPFFHQGISFILHKPDDNNYNGKVTVRCMWGSTKPIQALLDEVRKNAKTEKKVLSVTYVSSGYDEHTTCKKRLLCTVDLNPLVKQQLLTDLQDFFAEDTEDYYYQNGTSYRRGYLFYGPPGTGKTSLSTAIASNYDLPLCVINLAGMDDTMLQSKIKNLPKRCVILFEDIDAAGIVRERAMVSPSPPFQRKGSEEEEDAELPSSSSSPVPAASPGESAPSGPESSLLAPQPSRTKVTLSGLLNTLDGPGSREGHIVILTTNSPDSLDQAVYRPGRVDTQVHLGYADEITAGLTFIRIFGSDKKVKVSKTDLNRMGRRFGRLVPTDFLTPAEVQKFCKNRRGQPQKAIDEIRQFIKDKRTGKTNFQYDIHRQAPEVNLQDDEERPDDDFSDDEVFTPSSTDSSTREHTKTGVVTKQAKKVREQLHVAGGSGANKEDGLAYGE